MLLLLEFCQGGLQTLSSPCYLLPPGLCLSSTQNTPMFVPRLMMDGGNDDD